MKTRFKMPKAQCTIATLLLALTVLTCHAQSYFIDWYKIPAAAGRARGRPIGHRHHRPAGCKRCNKRGTVLRNGRLLESHFRGANTRTAKLDHHACRANSVVVSWPDTGSYTFQTNNNLTTSNWSVTAARSILATARTASPSRRPRGICFSDCVIRESWPFRN